MKISCGTDIIEISRIKQSIESHEESFKSNIFTENEVKYCESHKNQKYQHYAARFAAKEAIFKAISKQLNSKYDINWKDMEILNDEQGRPQVKIRGIQRENIDISISHCKGYAVAMVVMLID